MIGGPIISKTNFQLFLCLDFLGGEERFYVQLGPNARFRKSTKLLRTVCISDKVFERFLTRKNLHPKKIAHQSTHTI